MTKEDLKNHRDEKNLLVVYRQLNYLQRGMIFRRILDEYFAVERSKAECLYLIEHLVLTSEKNIEE